MAETADFKRAMRGLANNELLIPAITAALYNPTFQGFTLDVEGWTPRPYDGWFHPSSHSRWTVRQLYIYLTAHQTLEEERMPLTGVLAVTAGKFWHAFIQRILLDQGIMVPQPGIPIDSDPARHEVPILHPETNRRGHADGELKTGELLEIKTINGYQIGKATSEEWLKEKKPDYWGQTQDYLDCTGRDVMRYFMINPDYPFAKAEFLVRADQRYQTLRRGEYMKAIDLAERYPNANVLDDPATVVPVCCAPRSTEAKQCVAWRGCAIGRIGRV